MPTVDRPVSCPYATDTTSAAGMAHGAQRTGSVWEDRRLTGHHSPADAVQVESGETLRSDPLRHLLALATDCDLVGTQLPHLDAVVEEPPF